MDTGEGTQPQTLASVLAGWAGRPRSRWAGSRWREHLVLAGVFVAAVSRYLFTVLPCVARELAHWRARAGEIPDPVLRRHALQALRKRGNMEGAALFGVFAPVARRAETVRALVAFQAAYNYLDMLAEQPSADPVGNGHQLHQALLVALDQSATHPDYYAHYPQRDDGGYLAEMVDACRIALSVLPSYASAATSARRAAARIVDFQSLNLGRPQGDHDALEGWAREQTPAGTGLAWWETAAAGGSSLGVHVLIAAAAEPVLDPEDVIAIENAYFPWISALHSLLDSLVDVAEDERDGQRNFLSYYASPDDAAVSLKLLVLRATAAARALPQSYQHRVILTAMASYYLSAPEASALKARAISNNVADAVGALVGPALLLFRARRLFSRLARGVYR